MGKLFIYDQIVIKRGRNGCQTTFNTNFYPKDDLRI